MIGLISLWPKGLFWGFEYSHSCSGSSADLIRVHFVPLWILFKVHKYINICTNILTYTHTSTHKILLKVYCICRLVILSYHKPYWQHFDVLLNHKNRKLIYLFIINRLDAVFTASSPLFNNCFLYFLTNNKNSYPSTYFPVLGSIEYRSIFIY